MNQREDTNQLPHVQAPHKTSRRVFRITATLLAVSLLALSLALLAAGCGDDPTKGPEAIVQEFLTAMENKDIDTILALQDPEAIANMQASVASEGLTLDDVKSIYAEAFFSYDSIDFADVKFETTMTGDTQASVKIVGGSMTQTSDGVTETKNAGEAGTMLEFDLLQIDGEWYIDFESSMQ